ncbi:MAG: DJ-1/PfpI family protein [Planctomycetes bacterium]|nr:DJ-1/PfpI family protein [Planctomycetota bacterium]
MARAVVLLAPGFEEIEAVTVIDVLRRAGVETSSLATTARDVKGAHGIVLRADGLLAERAAETWDVVVLPGGMPGATNLRDDAVVQELLSRQERRGGLVAAICAAPIALARAGLLEGRAATCFPGFESQLGGADVREERVVVDGPVTTSRGPGTSLEFALSLVEQLVGADQAESLGASMLHTAPERSPSAS